MSATELKPCPFCGGQAAKFELAIGGGVIECLGCHARTYERLENLVSAWNERTLPEGMALVPREITAESGHKAGVIGEFEERIEGECGWCDGTGVDVGTCEHCHGSGTMPVKVPISWTTIKAIHRRVVEIAEAEKAGRRA